MARLDVTETLHGISFPGHMHTQDSLQYALGFKFLDTDVLIATYPKSGTTWMQEIVTLIHSGGDPHTSQTVPNWQRAPWIEQYYSATLLEASCQGRRIITTHLPYHLLAPALQGSKAKVIYVARNPKDAVVSYYHFHHMAQFLPEPGAFQEFLLKFLEGTLYYGSWFDHVKGWTSQAATMENLFYITYEDMWQEHAESSPESDKKIMYCTRKDEEGTIILSDSGEDLRGAIERVSSFLQCPLVEETINSVLRHCSFGSMKVNSMTNYKLIPQEIMDHSKGSFMRKGKTGDWRNTFTEEQSRHFDSVYTSRMQDCSISFPWDGVDSAQ